MNSNHPGKASINILVHDFADILVYIFITIYTNTDIEFPHKIKTPLCTQF